MNVAFLALAAAGALAWKRRKYDGAASLADKIPTTEVAGPIVLNADGSLAYGFALRPLPLLSSSSEGIGLACANFGEILRRAPDGAALHFIADIELDGRDTVEAYCKAKLASAGGMDAASYLAREVAKFNEACAFRRVRHYLYVCLPYEFQSAALSRTVGGSTLSRPSWDPDAYDSAIEKLERFASSVRRHLSSCGLDAEPLPESSILAFVQKQLNPGRHLPPNAGGGSHDVLGDMPSELRPFTTLRERLALSDLVADDPRHLRLGTELARVLTMKVLPDATFAGMLGPLFFDLPAPATVSFCVEKLPAETTMAALKMRRSMARGVSSLSTARDIDAEVQHAEIEAVMQSLSQSSACLCAVQLNCSVMASTEAELNRKVAFAEQAFARAGGLSTFREDYSHFESYMSMLPGAAHRFRRSRTVLDINAAHLAVPVGEWTGSPSGPLLARTRTGSAIMLDPFDDRLETFNGLIIGASGSGKSFLTNLILANHLASGGGAVVIDIGGSYRRLTSLFDGAYTDLGGTGDMGLNPFVSRREMAALREDVKQQRLQFLAGFAELRLTEKDEMPTSERAFIAKALAAMYDPERATPTATPIDLSVFEKFLLEFADETDSDMAVKMVRRLQLSTKGPRAKLLARPINLSLKPRIISIDLKSVEDDPELLATALYVLSFAIWEKVSELGRKVLIIFDECWKMLMNPVAMQLIENLYRTLRKYGAGIWCLSQSVQDFVGSRIGPALLANTYTRVLLKHTVDHDQVADICNLTDHGRAAFRGLTMARGEYSDAFVQSGDQAEVLRVVPSPLEYWMATTNAKDKALEAETRARHPNASTLQIVSSLARRYPKGAKAA